MIVEKLNELYAAQAEQESKREWYPRPSGLGGCLREAAHLLSGMPAEPRTPESMRLFELGHQRGRALALMAKPLYPDAVICDCGTESWDCLPTCSTTISIPTPWGGMYGHFDLWIPSLLTLVDFKTAGAYSMGLIVAGEKEDEGYALQLNAYRHGIAELPRQKNVSASVLWSLAEEWTPLEYIRTILVYEAKDSDAKKGVTAGMLHEVEVPYTAELEAKYQARLKKIALLLLMKESVTLAPRLVSGMPKDSKGKLHWRCAAFADGRPKYCSIGAIRGNCS